MNRTDRLLAIVIELQAHRRRRADDLAATFEVSKRTIYRDVLALCEAGVPVISTPGRGYSLDEGYFLPPLSFTADEAVLLLLGADVMRQSFDAEYQRVAELARSKIGGVLPERVRAEVERLQESIRFVEAGEARDLDVLRVVRRAIVQRRTLRFEYHTRYGEGGIREREADPYALARVGNAWYVAGFCHLRKSLRHFRIDRMTEVHVTARTFERPADYRPGPANERRSVIVTVLFDQESAPWVQETRMYFVEGYEERRDGLLVTLRVRHTDEIVQWILGWGRHVRVLEPRELRERIAAEAAAMLAHHEYEQISETA